MSLTHNSKIDKSEPTWAQVDKTALPDNAFADEKDRGYPHHWVKDGKKDKDGRYESGEMFLHQGGLNAAWSAANGGHTGKKASSAVLSHLEAHRKALGLDKKDEKQAILSIDQAPPTSVILQCVPINLSLDTEDEDKERAGGSKKSFAINAYSGQPCPHPYFGQLVHDVAGMKVKDQIALDYLHDPKDVIGYAIPKNCDDGVVLDATLTPFKPDDRASEILAKSKMGCKWEASIMSVLHSVQRLDEGELANVNGYSFTGPGAVAREWELVGCAICPHGLDRNTSVELAMRTVEETMPVEISAVVKQDIPSEEAVVPAQPEPVEPVSASRTYSGR